MTVYTQNGNGLLIPGVCGQGMHLGLDGFRLIYVCIAVFMWAVSGVFSGEYMAHYEKRGRYYRFFWATFAATVGVFLSADLYTTFIFFEIMSFTSYVWVAFDEKKESLKAAQTYLAIAVIGGMVMLMGLFLLYDQFGTLEMDALGPLAGDVLARGPGAERLRLYTAGGLLLFGFGAKAGCFPLHIWLPRAHPAAPAPASALLSGILTKAGVFGIIYVSCILFAGDKAWGELIAGLGFATMFIGALLALLSTNLKRTLACSSISQIGFILAGISTAVLLENEGLGNALAVHGAFLHMISHSLIKLVLFLCAGVVYMNLHELEFNAIRGFGRGKPALLFCFLMGALGIAGIPLWNGYISKTLLHEGIVEYTAAIGAAGLWKWSEGLFLLSGGMTVAYMLKLFVMLFVDRNPERQREFDAMTASYMKMPARAALIAAAVPLPALGALPHLTMDRLAAMGAGFFGLSEYGHAVSYFSLENLKGGLITVGIGAALYLGVVRTFMIKKEAGGPVYVDRWPSWLDLEYAVYRPALTLLTAVCAVLCRAMDHLADGVIVLARRTTHSQLPEPATHKEGNWLAHFFGSLADGSVFLWDKLTGRMELYGKRRTAVSRLLNKEVRIKYIGRLVEESFSFGLMLFCIGLCATLGYQLWVLVA